MSYNDLDADSREIAERVLTHKQLAVFKLWCAGVSDHRIALMLDIHPSTARGHRIRAVQLIGIEKRRSVY